MPRMQTNFKKGLIQLLARNLYPEPDVFIRELIQNAHDAIKIRRISEPHLEKADIEDFLSTIGVSGTRERTKEYLELGDRKLALGTIGQFGIGILSAFVVADKIEDLTRKLGTDICYQWVNHGGEEYELEAVSERR